MGLIAVEGMHFHAHHGFYEEERILGSDFVVDAYIETDFDKAAEEDELADTINYEIVFLVVKSEMAKPSRLTETVAKRIVKNIKSRFDNIKSIRVRISKSNPPLRGKVDRFYVEISQEHQAKCPKTGKGFFCYKDENCWCTKKRISQETRDLIKAEFKSCLSPEALAFYEG
ncbi:MAG: dihydroneopterin aldolase [Bacteroidota bacterium]